MNKLQKFIAVLRGASSDIDRYFINNMGSTEFRDKAVLEDPYSNVSLVYTCISTTARAIAQVPLMVVKYDSRGNPIPVEHNHPWQKLLDRPNYMMNRTSFVEAIISYLMLDGNVCIIPFPPNYSGVPQALWPVRWKFMSYETDKTTGHIKKWIYKPNDNVKVELGPMEVLHLRFWNPNHPIDGLAPSVAGKLPILSLQRASKYNFDFFENGAVASGILHTDKQLSKASFDRVKSQIHEQHGVKQGQAHKMMVLEQGLKWSATGVTHRDMEFPELHHLNSEQILQIYGMKKSIISITADLNFATAQSERKEWWHGTCLPLMNFIEETLAFGFFSLRGVDFDVLFDISSIAALHEAFSEKVKTADVLLRLGFTRNEVNSRMELGFPNVEWGDIAYMPVNMMPVNIEGEPPQPGGDGDNDPQNPPDVIEDPENEPEKPESDTSQQSVVDLHVKYLMEKIKPYARTYVNSIESKISKNLFRWRISLLKSMSESVEKGQEFLKSYNYDQLFHKIMGEIASPAVALQDMMLFMVHNVENTPTDSYFLGEITSELQNLMFLAQERLNQVILGSFELSELISKVKAELNKTFGSIDAMIFEEMHDFVSKELIKSGFSEKETENPEKVEEKPKKELFSQPININITIPPENKPTQKKVRIIRNDEGLMERAEIVEE